MILLRIQRKYMMKPSIYGRRFKVTVGYYFFVKRFLFFLSESRRVVESLLASS